MKTRHFVITPKKIQKFFGRVVAGFLAAMLCFALIQFPSRAADAVIGETANALAEKEGTGKKVSNAYILEVVTGANPGTFIGFFQITYTSGGKEYKQFLFPQEDSESIGRKEVQAVGSDDSKIKWVNDNMGYTTQNLWSMRGDSLRSYKTTQFYFHPTHPIEKVTGIDAYANLKPDEAKEWTCQGLRIFSVEEVYGLYMNGNFSNDFYMDFKGHLIAELVTQTYNWACVGARMLRMDRVGGTIRTDFEGIGYANHVTQDIHTFGFRADFADIYGGGFECLAATYEDNQLPFSQMKLAETLCINVTFTDVYGQTRVTHFPAIISTAEWLSDRGYDNATIGLAQQGTSIGFTGTIPDCQEITSCSLSVGHEQAKLNSEIAYTKTFNTRSNREKESETDAIKITAFAIYDMAKSEFSGTMDNAILRYRFTGNPILYYMSGNAEGVDFPIKNVTGVSLLKYEEEKAFEDKLRLNFEKKRECYLFEIDTDDINAAATAADLSIKFKYVTMTGVKQETEDLSIKDLINQYYGYWPGSVDSFAYRYGTSRGGTLRFFLDLKNVDYFTGCVISMGLDGDDYQLSAVRMYHVTTIGERKATWTEIVKDNVKSHLEFSRVVNGKPISQSDASTIILNIDQTVLIQPGTRQPYDFKTATIEEVEDEKIDLDKYTISYNEAMKNFGFTKVRRDYEVSVKVYDDAIGADGGTQRSTSGYNDSDSGSNNKFYFQLVFSYGFSAIVEANQQLRSDRFQSGATHVFHIQTNYDYGEVVGVRIIPDDFSSDNTKYDKLNIQQISIIEGESKGTHRCWEANDINWIGIDYTEEGQLTGVIPKAGRTMAELSKKTYSIDHVSNVIDLEFSLRTALGDKTEAINPTTNKMERIYADQLQSRLWGHLHYVDTNGKDREKTYDLVKAMYSYMNKQVSESESGVMSDPAWMLREGHTDRFILSVPDLRSVKAMEIEIKDPVNHPYMWNIAGVSGKMVEERGRLRLNRNDEYEYEYPAVKSDDENATPFTQVSGTNPAHTVRCESATQTVWIAFNENSFKIDVERGVATTVYSRLPVSKDDKMNIYAFPSEGNYDPISSYDLNAKVFYAHPAGLYTAEADKMNKFYGDEKTRPMFYALGLPSSGMIDINRIQFWADTEAANYTSLDYAIIQQVRQDTVIATYFVNLNKESPTIGVVEKFPTKDTSIVGYSEYQNVALQLGMGTDTLGLYKDRTDVGVSIEYKASFDPGGLTYKSPIIYLTDQQINQIREGKVIDLKFQQFFVGEVTGINVLKLGKMGVSVSNAYVATYHRDLSDNDTLQGWYSFGTGITVEESPTPMIQTANTFESADVVKPLTLTFTTQKANTNFESGTTDTVQATITVSDINDNPQTPLGTIPDLKKYIVEGQQAFVTGMTQKVKLLITGAKDIRRIRLEPIRGDGTAGWSIESASAQLGDDISATRMVNDRFYEGNPKDITFANISLTALVFNFNNNTNAFDQHRITNDTLNLIAPSGQPVKFNPTVNGSEMGVEVKAVEVNGDSVSGNLSSYLSYSEGNYEFKPPANQSGKTRYYRIIVNAVENPGAKIEINITVDSEDPSTYMTYTVYTTGEGGDSSQYKKAGEQVTISAGDVEGKVFYRWVVQTGGVILIDPYKQQTTFTMPANDVTIKAEYTEVSPIKQYSLKLSFESYDGYVKVNGNEYHSSNTWTFEEKSAVRIEALGNIYDNRTYEFDRWTWPEGANVPDAIKKDPTNPTPGSFDIGYDIELTAVFKIQPNPPG